MRAALILLLAATAAHPQWTLQQSNTTASLRGIHAVTPQIAWASGTEGTVLHTTDGGTTWQRCTTPPNADTLDFRGIQAFDANTAIVMSSGKGDLSRLYKTTNACKSWTLVLKNPEEEGFWDTLQATFDSTKKAAIAMVAGDPVGGYFTAFKLKIPLLGSQRATFIPILKNSTCRQDAEPQFQLPSSLVPCLAQLSDRYLTPLPRKGEALFAASNSSALEDPRSWIGPNLAIITGGTDGPRFLQFRTGICAGLGCEHWVNVNLPLSTSTSAGAFSLASTSGGNWHGVIVGGDYLKPDVANGTAAFSEEEGEKWQAATTLPQGYRSAVTYDPTTKTWLTVGPNGTDISTDDGRNWHALHPSATDTPDADQHWNALSLPFVVGPKGRIGKLNPQALKP